jgi:hypothetical protein
MNCLTALEIQTIVSARLFTYLAKFLEIILGAPGKNGSELCFESTKQFFPFMIDAINSARGKWA